MHKLKAGIAYTGYTWQTMYHAHFTNLNALALMSTHIECARPRRVKSSGVRQGKIIKSDHLGALPLNGLINAQAAQSYPVLLITLYLYINSILKIIRKSCVINLLRYIFI
jgi:hypothetical protein